MVYLPFVINIQTNKSGKKIMIRLEFRVTYVVRGMAKAF